MNIIFFLLCVVLRFEEHTRKSHVSMNKITKTKNKQLEDIGFLFTIWRNEDKFFFSIFCVSYKSFQFSIHIFFLFISPLLYTYFAMLFWSKNREKYYIVGCSLCFTYFSTSCLLNIISVLYSLTIIFSFISFYSFSESNTLLSLDKYFGFLVLFPTICCCCYGCMTSIMKMMIGMIMKSIISTEWKNMRNAIHEIDRTMFVMCVLKGWKRCFA